MSTHDGLTAEQRSGLTTLLGPGTPASPGLVLALAEAVRDRREHQHEPREDLYCANLTSWLGERMAPVLRRLLDAEAEVERLRQQQERIAELEARPSRATVLWEAADRMRREADGLPDAGQVHHKQVLYGGAIVLDKQADDAERDEAGKDTREGESTREPLLVDRFDVAMESAPEEEPVLTIGAVAEDGRPVALQLDREARAKVAGWLTPWLRADLLREAADEAHVFLGSSGPKVAEWLRARAAAYEAGQGQPTAVRGGEWYGLPWAAWLNGDDLSDFLSDLCAVALDYYRMDGPQLEELLRAVEGVCGTARAAADADRGQLTAPGPDAAEQSAAKLRSLLAPSPMQELVARQRADAGRSGAHVVVDDSDACKACGEPPSAWCPHCAGCACPDGRAETHAPGGTCPTASAAEAGEGRG
ncbi:hypothetical protein [Streptomyces sp. B15]|uniref:hypothetical protein n=1 Tax=Streptomyces sp. B15 TaxID=1537797 RepID=UPI001B39BFB7|nr:hypothetical protein [Streptomyces sp. B15]MBQ1122590.1 hypothetical protein [Streptomyces sp. B15]